MHSVEALSEALRPIASVMVEGDLSASMLVRAAKLAYVRAAIANLKFGTAKANVSRLSVVTGMTRKEVASFLKEKTDAQKTTSPKKSMEHRALRVLRGWTTDPLYRTREGRPLDLPVDGEGRTLASLVRSYGGDVTTIAVLRELERINVVTRGRSDRLRVKVRRVQARLHSISRFKDFSRALADFSHTAAQLIAERKPPLYFGFKELNVPTASQAESFKQSFGRRAALLLDGVEHWGRRQSGKHRDSSAADNGSKQRVGLGVYLVQNFRPTDEMLPRRRR